MMRLLSTLLAVFLLIGVSASAQTSPQQSMTETRKAVTRYSNYIYEYPTISKLSQLYWAIGKFKQPDDKMIDHFMMINECQIYQNFSGNEIEWSKIRKSAREFLDSAKDQFPIRFEFIQSLNLGRYDTEKQEFDVLEKYKLDGVRRFEILADDFYSDLCGYDPSNAGRNIEGYPRGLMVEFNRPLTLLSVPVKKEMASKYIEDKMINFNNLEPSKRTQENLYAYRDAYMFLRVKVFAYKGERRNSSGQNLAEVMAVLESYDIYADRKKKVLLFKNDFRGRGDNADSFDGNSLDNSMKIPDPNPNDWENEKGGETDNIPGEKGIPEYNPGYSE
jgi:hypothetical protein